MAGGEGVTVGFPSIVGLKFGAWEGLEFDGELGAYSPDDGAGGCRLMLDGAGVDDNVGVSIGGRGANEGGSAPTACADDGMLSFCWLNKTASKMAATRTAISRQMTAILP